MKIFSLLYFGKWWQSWHIFNNFYYNRISGQRSCESFFEHGELPERKQQVNMVAEDYFAKIVNKRLEYLLLFSLWLAVGFQKAVPEESGQAGEFEGDKRSSDLQKNPSSADEQHESLASDLSPSLVWEQGQETEGTLKNYSWVEIQVTAAKVTTTRWRVKDLARIQRVPRLLP